jgi:hypothetical protein
MKIVYGGSSKADRNNEDGRVWRCVFPGLMPLVWMEDSIF